MAEKMASEMAKFDVEIHRISNHLKNQPIAGIFKNSNEKDNIVALKFMAVVDFHIQRNEWKLYDRINNSSPKLMSQLLQFRSYETFTYYEYLLN